MFTQMLMPLDRQFDDGHWAVAEAFKAGAERLEAATGVGMRDMHGHFPINYLYRHAVELYLKSAIVTTHRALTLPTGDGPHTKDPKIKEVGGWRKLDRTHSTKALLDEFIRTVEANDEAFRRLTPTKWRPPVELVEWIDTIESYDRGSTLFRYAQSGNRVLDAAKSSFQSVSAEDALAEANRAAKPEFILAMLDDQDEVVEMFHHVTEVLPGLRPALKAPLRRFPDAHLACTPN